MPPSGKKRSASFIDDSDDSAVAAPSAPKKSKNTTSSTTNGSGKDDDGNPFWELSNKRRVGVSQFKNMSFINIREYYEKDGKTLPGKKGISLSVEQYATLLKFVPAINAELRELGHDIDDSSPTSKGNELTVKKTKRERPTKANIEATSEEDN